MGHVDDPHQAEGDRQPQAHHQQDRGEAETIEHIADEVAQAQIAFDRGDGLVHGLVDGDILLLPDEAFEQGQSRLGTGSRDMLHSMAAYLGIRVEKLQLIEGFDHHWANARISFVYERLLDQPYPGRVAQIAKFQCCSSTRLGIRVSQADHIEHALQQRSVGLLYRHLYGIIR